MIKKGYLVYLLNEAFKKSEKKSEQKWGINSLKIFKDNLFFIERFNICDNNHPSKSIILTLIKTF